MIAYITEADAVKLHKLDGKLVVEMINSNCLKSSHDGYDTVDKEKVRKKIIKREKEKEKRKLFCSTSVTGVCKLQ